MDVVYTTLPLAISNLFDKVKIQDVGQKYIVRKNQSKVLFDCL